MAAVAVAVITIVWLGADIDRIGGWMIQVICGGPFGDQRQETYQQWIVGWNIIEKEQKVVRK